jgi:hypothetical protein
MLNNLATTPESKASGYGARQKEKPIQEYLNNFGRWEVAPDCNSEVEGNENVPIG